MSCNFKENFTFQRISHNFWENFPQILREFHSSVEKISWQFLREYVMWSEKPYTKSENVILRKHNLKWFGQEILIFSFQQKYVESVASNIWMQIRVSSDKSTSNYSEKCERYTTNRNHAQSHHCSRQTWSRSLLYEQKPCTKSSV